MTISNAAALPLRPRDPFKPDDRPLLHLEDLEVGQTFAGRMQILVDEESIVAFAREFDRQPFHLDAAAAKNSFYGDLIASGWHLASIAMRLQVEDGPRLAGGTIGFGVEELSWLRPVRRGDRVSQTSQVVEVRPSQSKPGFGILRLKVEMRNQNGDVVQLYVCSLLVPRRHAADRPAAAG